MIKKKSSLIANKEEYTISNIQAKKILDQIKKNITSYFQSFDNKVNKAYFDFVKSIKIDPAQQINTFIRIQNSTTGQFENIQTTFQISTRAEIQFQGLIIDKVEVFAVFPQVLIGENFILPQIVVRAQTYKPWFGNFALTWEGLTGKKNKFGFYPYEKTITRKKELLQYSNENIVDPICDLINNTRTSVSVQVKKFVAKLTSSKRRQVLQYQSAFKKDAINTLDVPITCEYHKNFNISLIEFKFFAVGNDWIPLSEIVLDLLSPLSQSTAYFNDDGEMKSDSEIGELLDEWNSKASQTPKRKRKDKNAIRRNEPWDPFKTDDPLKRDEFGFLMDVRSDESEFGSKEFSSATEKVLEARYKKSKELKTAEVKATPPEPQDVSRWPTATAWYNELQGKRFIVEGDTSVLSFTERGELNLITACNPPFMLRFARDEIRLKEKMLGTKVVKLMFKYYKMGYLRLKLL